jgi:hypothetical protein
MDKTDKFWVDIEARYPVTSTVYPLAPSAEVIRAADKKILEDAVQYSPGDYESSTPKGVLFRDISSLLEQISYATRDNNVFSDEFAPIKLELSGSRLSELQRQLTSTSGRYYLEHESSRSAFRYFSHLLLSIALINVMYSDELNDFNPVDAEGTIRVMRFNALLKHRMKSKRGIDPENIRSVFAYSVDELLAIPSFVSCSELANNLFEYIRDVLKKENASNPYYRTEEWMSSLLAIGERSTLGLQPLPPNWPMCLFETNTRWVFKKGRDFEFEIHSETLPRALFEASGGDIYKAWMMVRKAVESELTHTAHKESMIASARKASRVWNNTNNRTIKDIITLVEYLENPWFTEPLREWYTANGVDVESTCRHTKRCNNYQFMYQHWYEAHSISCCCPSSEERSDLCLNDDCARRWFKRTLRESIGLPNSDPFHLSSLIELIEEKVLKDDPRELIYADPPRTSASRKKQVVVAGKDEDDARIKRAKLIASFASLRVDDDDDGSNTEGLSEKATDVRIKRRPAI